MLRLTLEPDSKLGDGRDRAFRVVRLNRSKGLPMTW